MKWINKLKDKDLEELYSFFNGENFKIIEFNIVRSKHCIELCGKTEFVCGDRKYSITDDDYRISDFHAQAYNRSGDTTLEYRLFMYKKFGDEYARDFLFGDEIWYIIDRENGFEIKEPLEVSDEE
nr:MAG TPA: hypothetical protein [Caudoviricetes sp.]